MTRQTNLAIATYLPRKPRPGFTIMDTSITTTRVRPGDLDIYYHVNNAVYLNMMDAARANFLADCNGLKSLNKLGWYPVVAASTIKYKSSLLLGNRVEISTRVHGWDPRVAYLEQIIRHDDKIVTEAIVAARFLVRGGGKVPAPHVVELLGGPQDSPALPDHVVQWAQAVDVYYRETPQSH
ncbi:acyl-CoA thioesterase [Timonella sp. A28]|uniref:acyl-CoA thioesterase n=1 Tax=Timonella sp. A28 TaxID=3442640 RepID=UPI003EBEF453